MPQGAVKGTLTVAANSITNPTSATGSVAVSVNDLIYFVLAEQTNLTVTTVSDNLGNNYTALNAGSDAGAATGRAYQSIATVGGTLTSINATCTASTDNVVAIGVVFGGPFVALDANPANITNDITSPFTCPATGTLAQGPELIVAWGSQDGSTSWSATAPLVLALATQTSQAVQGLTVGSQLVNATSTVSPAFTAGSAPGATVLGTSTFKLAPILGWETQPVQPAHPRVEKFAAMALTPNVEAPFVFAAPAVDFGQETPQPNRPQIGIARRSAAVGRSQFASFNSPPISFDQGGISMPAARRASRVGVIQSEDGNEGVTQPPAAAPILVESTVPVTARAPVRKGGIAGRSHFASFNSPAVGGWESQAWAPPHPSPERRSGGIARGDDGAQAPLIRFSAPGWEVQPWQAPHPRREKAGAVVAKDDGTHAAFRFLQVPGWEVQPVQPAHPRPERFAAVAPVSNIEARFASWFNVGLEQQAPQPNHPRFERAGVLTPPSNIEAAKVNFFAVGFEQASAQPVHPAPERRFAAIAPRDDGAASPLPQTSTPFGHDAPATILRRQPRQHPAQPSNVEAAYATWFSVGFEQQPPQPNHPRPERGGAAAIGASVEAVYIPVGSSAALGWQQVASDMPRRRVVDAQATAHWIETRLVAFNAHGFSAQEWQPPHPRAERSGSVQIGSAIDAQFAAPASQGWQVLQADLRARRAAGAPSWTPWPESPPLTLSPFAEVQAYQPVHPRPERAAAVMLGDPGTQAAFAFNVVPAAYGWWQTNPEVRRPRLSLGGIAGRSSFAAFNSPYLWGWEAQAFGPSRPRAARAGALHVPDLAIAPAGAPSVAATYGWWPTNPEVRRPKLTVGGLAGRNSFASFNNPFRWGWEPQAWIIPHRKTEKAGALQAGSNIEAPLVPPPIIPLVAVGYESPSVYRRRTNPSGATRGRSGFAFFSPFVPYGFDGATVLQRKAHATGALAADSGALPRAPAAVAWGYEAPQAWRARPKVQAFSAAEPLFTASSLLQFGWQTQPWQPPHPRRERFGSVAPVSNVEARFIPWFNVGFEPAIAQPLHPRPEKGGILPGAINADVPPPPVSTAFGFEVPAQPAPRRQGRSSALAGAAGSDSPLIPFQAPGWEIQAPQPPRQRQERRGAFLSGDPGSAAALINWLGYGWAVQPPQPNHPRPERSAALARGDDGSEAVFQFQPPPPVLLGFDPAQILLRRYVRQVPTYDDGIQATLVNWRNVGWEIAPPHPRQPTRNEVLDVGDAGIEARLIAAPSVAWFETHAPVLRRPPRRSGDWLAAVDAQFARWFNAGWETAPPQLRRLVTAKNFGQASTIEAAFPWINDGWEQAEAQPVHRRFAAHPWVDQIGRLVPPPPPPAFIQSGSDTTLLRNPRRLFIPDFFGFRDFGAIFRAAAIARTLVRRMEVDVKVTRAKTSTIVSSLSSRTKVR